MTVKTCSLWDRIFRQKKSASLTVEAAFVLPVFLYCMIAFLYFIQIFLLQEHIQQTITRIGLSMAKTAYVYGDFQDSTSAFQFDETIFGEEVEIGLGDFAASLIDPAVIKLYAGKYLDKERINHSCIENGFDGISFSGSQILQNNQWIDILVHYRIKLPVKLFIMEDMPMLQRIRIRGWTGLAVAATYSMEEEASAEDMVYVTETGSVYHKTDSCSHIRLSVRAVQGIPSELRNDSGAKYYPCESCGQGEPDEFSVFYITSEGTRYHTRRDCSRIKRSVKAILKSEAGSRAPCKRCWN